MLSCIAKINPQKDIPDEVSLTADELYINFPDIGKENAPRELKKASDRLWDRSIIVKDPKQTEEFRWVQRRVHYHKGEARITISFSDSIKKYISQLSGQFTRLNLQNIAGLSSTYSIRLYELLQQFASTGARMITVKDIRELLQVTDVYPQFKELNRRVITPAVKELNKKSNYKIEVSPAKKGRKIESLLFTFREKEQLEMQV